MKPIPIRRKGCKNVGWIWDKKKQHKLVVKLHPEKPMTYMSEVIEFPYLQIGFVKNWSLIRREFVTKDWLLGKNEQVMMQNCTFDEKGKLIKV